MFAKFLRYLPAHDTAMPACACMLHVRGHVSWCSDTQVSFKSIMSGLHVQQMKMRRAAGFLHLLTQTLFSLDQLLDI